VIAYRNADRRFPFLWEDSAQPPERWHGAGEGPAQYLSDTPNGAWAEFLRHEEIRDATDVPTVNRAIWAVEIGDPSMSVPRLPAADLRGDPSSYARCRSEARRLRSQGARALEAPSAALVPGAARGWRVDGGVVGAEPRDGKTIVLWGRRPEVVGWPVVMEAAPDESLLPAVRHFGAAP